MSVKRDCWFTPFSPSPSAKIRLYCFPYAGGDATTIYHSWAKQVGKDIEVCAVHLPGRGRRMSESIPLTIPSLTEPIARAIASQTRPNQPFALFGHSMGALLAFETGRKLKADHALEPNHLFVSGRRSPHSPDPRPNLHTLPAPSFKQAVIDLNGSPKGIFEIPEMAELLLPILRADFQLCETHPLTHDNSLTCPIMVFGGIQDDIPPSYLEAWELHTKGPFALHRFPGDHFFIKSAESDLLRILTTTLKPRH